MLDKDLVKEYYSCHTRKDTAKHFGVTEGELRKFLKDNGLQRSAPGFIGDEVTNKNRLKALKDNFWSDTTRTQEAKRKAEDTMDERYGDRAYNITKGKQTMRSKYGVDTYMEHPDFKNKSKDTMVERYGVDNPLANKSILHKVEQTNLGRYGAKNVLSKDSSLREYRDSIMVNKYGGVSPIQNEGLKAKIQATLLSKYGVDNPGLVHINNSISKEELSLADVLGELGFIHNNSKQRFYKRFQDGKVKYPDYYNDDCRCVVEYNGTYWHPNDCEPIYWETEWFKLGYRVSIIWDFELSEFIKNPPKNIDDLLNRFPCTYRTKMKTGEE